MKAHTLTRKTAAFCTFFCCFTYDEWILSLPQC